MADVELHPYDPGWPDRFENERERVEAATGDGLLGVFHIGSTAIEEFPAKDAVDVLAVFDGTDPLHATKERLLDEFRVHRDERGEFRVHRDEPDRVVLVRSNPSVVLHLRPREVEGWKNQLVFRELLREDPEARAMYEGAKRTAAAEYPDDGEAYTAAKEPVIERLIERAYAEGYDERLPGFADASG